jgi:hypothetical protein
VPKEHIITKKFMLVGEFFTDPLNKLPLILKRMACEAEDSHRQRVKMYLQACPDTKFTDFADLIDPQNVYHNGFF